MTTFLGWFEETKKIYGICPCCRELFRLSDADLFTKTPPPRTPFDHVADQQRQVEKQIVRFEEKEDGIRDEAKARGQRKAKRRLKRLSPYFFGPNVDLKEVKLLFDPVQYIVFKGLGRNSCSLVEFVDHPPETKERELILGSLSAAIQAGNIEWQTFRVDDSGKVIPETTRRSAPQRRPSLTKALLEAPTLQPLAPSLPAAGEVQSSS